MRDTQNIIHIVTPGSKGFEIVLTPDQLPNAIEWLTDQYYKGGVEDFWVNGVKFEEPLA